MTTHHTTLLDISLSLSLYIHIHTSSNDNAPHRSPRHLSLSRCSHTCTYIYIYIYILQALAGHRKPLQRLSLHTSSAYKNRHPPLAPSLPLSHTSSTYSTSLSPYALQAPANHHTLLSLPLPLSLTYFKHLQRTSLSLSALQALYK